jgi:hypothetical protein
LMFAQSHKIKRWQITANSLQHGLRDHQNWG